MNIQFGTGVLFGNPVLGNQPVNPSPFRFGVLQECQIDFKSDLKKLFGQSQFPVATARGKVEVNIKAKMAVFDPNMLNQLFFAQPSAVGVKLMADAELHTAAAAAITVSNIPIVEDWGLQYASTRQQLLFVAGAPAVGQYNVNLTTGVYSLAAGDNTNVIAASYTYTATNRGTTITLAGQLMGYAPELKMFFYNLFRNKYFALELNDVTLGTINFPSKLEDFWISDLEGSANLDAGNNLGSLYLDLF